MGKTYIVGARKVAKLGVHVPVPVAPSNITKNTMYYVVARNCALALQGYKAIKCKTFTTYAVYKTQAQAKQHIAVRKMGLYACIVAM